MAQTTITDRINAAFERSGANQSELARRLGLTRAAVNGWLKGRSVNIRPEHLFAVADALDVEARWLATGTGPMERQRLCAEQRHVLDAYRALDSAGQHAVATLLNQIAEAKSRYG